MTGEIALENSARRTAWAGVHGILTGTVVVTVSHAASHGTVNVTGQCYLPGQNAISKIQHIDLNYHDRLGRVHNSVAESEIIHSIEMAS